MRLKQVLSKLIRYRILVIVGSAHKVGSTWGFNLLKNYCRLSNLEIPRHIIEHDKNIDPSDIDLKDIVNIETISYGAYIHKTHAYPIQNNIDPKISKFIKFITVIRDPRDIVVSASFYLAWLPVEEGEWGGEYSKLNEKDRMLRIIEDGEFIIRRLHNWFHCPYAYKIRYEDMVYDGFNELKRILDYLGVAINEQKINETYEKRTFKSLTGRESGVENKTNFMRKGVTGDWLNYFDDRLKNTFKSVKEGAWNNLLISMGYENNRDW